MHSSRPLILGSVVAAIALSPVAAGCSGARSPGVASIASSTTVVTTPQNGLVAYSACMRSHGVPTFPDPDNSGGIPKPQVVAARSNNPTRFDAADTACRGLLPPNGSLAPQETAQQKRARLANELSFAKCVRKKGVARFPDPSAQGDLSVEMVQAQGIDVHSPAFLRVVQACLPASHGGLTAAKVKESLKNAGG